MDSEAEDDNSGPVLLLQGAEKRMRYDNPDLPTIIDIAKFNGKLGTEAPVNSQNRFAILGELDIENVAAVKSSGAKPKNSSAGKTIPAKSLCPPIFLYNVDIKRLVDQLEAKTPKIEFKIKNVN